MRQTNVRGHMEVVGADDEHVGVVDLIDDPRIG